MAEIVNLAERRRISRPAVTEVFARNPVEEYATAFAGMLRARQELDGWQKSTTHPSLRENIAGLDGQIVGLVREMDWTLSRSQTREVSSLVAKKLAAYRPDYLL